MIKKVMTILLFIIVILISCAGINSTDTVIKKDEDLSSDETGILVIEKPLERSSLNDIKRAVISIEDGNGNIIFNRYTIEMKIIEDNLKCNGLKLEKGAYRLTELLFVNETNDVIFASPINESLKATDVSLPLPMNFIIKKNTITIVNPEITGTSLFIAADFGYVSFTFEILQEELVVYQPADFVKTNNQKIFVHYTPWYETPEISGKWSWHWKMDNGDYSITNMDLASYFYPLIGPYDTSDPDLLEYHALLMKMSGVDGAVINWYGTYDIYDYLIIDQHAKKAVDVFEKAGIKLIICYEDRSIEEALHRGLTGSINEKMSTDFNYLEDNYFNKSNYFKYDGNPILLNFGPIYVTDYNKWQEAFSTLNCIPVYAPLWGFFDGKPSYSDVPGEFAWVWGMESDPYSTNALNNWYIKVKNSSKDFVIGSAYPGFNDYWDEGGTNIGPFRNIPYDNGLTFINTLNMSKTYNPDILQIVTWNDFQEGTQIEPTVEDGYKYLNMLQNFTGINTDEDDLKMAKRIYDLRKLYKNNKNIQIKLSNIFYLIISDQMNQARIKYNELSRF